jgi:hypothetical protein
MIDSRYIVKKNVDGQELLLPTRQQIEVILNQPMIDEVILKDIFVNEIRRVLPYMVKYPELSIALGSVTFGEKQFWRYYPYSLLEIDNNLQRVFLEILICNNCKWKGMTANPKDTDIYFGIPNDISSFDLIRYSNKYPTLPCPICSERLPRHPIWVEH